MEERICARIHPVPFRTPGGCVSPLALASGSDAIVCLIHSGRESVGPDSRLSLFPRTDKENLMSSKKPTNEHTSVVENEREMREAEHQQTYGAAPSIQRLDIETPSKLLTIPEDEEPLNGYRCFIALTDRVREERGDFFLQPHRTSVVWGGQKALFIFEHHSGKFGLYYDVQTTGLISGQSGGGAFESSTIVMKNRIFIPVPEGLRNGLLPTVGEKKKLEVRCDILYTERD